MISDDKKQLLIVELLQSNSNLILLYNTIPDDFLIGGSVQGSKTTEKQY